MLRVGWGGSSSGTWRGDAASGPGPAPGCLGVRYLVADTPHDWLTHGVSKPKQEQSGPVNAML